MIGMKKRLVVLSMLMLTLTISAQKKWTMQECIDYAMANNITLQKSKLQKQSATEDLKGSKAALLPTLNASTNQSVGYQPWKDSGVSTVTNGMVNTKVDKTYYNGSYAVNAQWTVWNGNRNTNTIKLNKITEDEAELQSKETANSIQERIAQLYTQILSLDENVKVNEQMLETAKKNEELGQEIVNVGKMSKADLAQLEITDETEFDVAIPEITDTMVLKEVPTLQGVYEQALLNRPEIERSKLAIKSSDVNLSVAKAGWLPTVSMTGSFGTSTNSLSSNGWGKQMKTNFDAMAGVSVSVPIYDGRSTKTSVNKAKIQQLSAQLDLLDQQKTLYSTIQEYWLNAQTNQQKYKAACATVESEQQSFDLLQEQFRLGLKNIVELMTGKDNLLSAQQNQLQSKYQTIYNQQMLKFYETGEM